jgi:hypothetical protein
MRLDSEGGRLRVLAYRLLGTLFLGLGIVGAFLPLLPTTVFLIVAAYFYARSSPKLYRRLVGHPRFGRYIQEWEARRAMPKGAKTVALSFTVLGTALAVAIIPAPIAQLLVLAVALGLMLALLRIPVY